MAEMEMSCEFAPRGTKRQFEDEYKEEGDGVYSDDDEGNNNVYDYSDHSDCERLDGTRVDPKVMEQYKKELKESEGFDITVYAGGTCNQVIVPMIDHLNDPESKHEFTDLCNLALDTFNSKNATNYVFLDILWVTASFSAGIFYYFTFQATDTTHGLKTFQALVWDGVAAGDTDVEICRIKESSSDDGSPHSSVDEESPHSSVDGSPHSTVDEESPQSSVDGGSPHSSVDGEAVQ